MSSGRASRTLAVAGVACAMACAMAWAYAAPASAQEVAPASPDTAPPEPPPEPPPASEPPADAPAEAVSASAPASAAAPATVEVPPGASGATTSPVTGEVPLPLGRPRRVAVYDFTAQGVEPLVGTVVTDAVVAEVRKLDGVVVLSMTEVRAMLGVEANKQIAGCADDSCLAEIAEALGADTVIIGSVARLGEDTSLFNARRIEQREAKTTGVVNQRLAVGNGEEYLAAVGPAIEGLFPDHALRADQTRGVSEEIALRLHPPPLEPWVFWTGAAVVGALAVGAIAITGTWVALDRSFATYKQGEIDKDVFEERKDQVLAANVATWIGWGVVASAAVGLACVYVLTDFDGARDATVEVQ